MRRILVTGATGFIGRQTLAPLRTRDLEVHAVSLDHPDSALRPLAVWHHGNLLEPESVRAVLEQVKPDGLLHFAWETTHGTYWSNPANLDWTAASLQLFADFARAGGQRIVVGGTCAEYAWQAMPLTEDQTLIAPVSLYGHCKNAVRIVLDAWAGATGLSWAWGRMFFPFGPYEKPQRLVPKVIKALLTGNSLPFDAATSVRDFMDVRDIGEAFAALLASPVQGTVNIASGHPVSIRTIVEALAEYAGDKSLVRFGQIRMNDAQPCEISACTRRLNEEVGWFPQKPLEERLLETFDWWRDHSAAGMRTDSTLQVEE